MSLRMIFSLTLVSLLAAHAQAISSSSTDTFDSTNEGWRVGSAGVQPAFDGGNSFNNQPGFLRHESVGSGPNGKWLMWTEESDWTGDYQAANIGAISLWADNVAGGDLPVWLGFDGPGGWFHTPAQTIVAADDWKRYEFDLANLIHFAASGGTGDQADTLGDVTRFEIFAGPGPVSYAGNGDILRAGTSTNVVWIDNIAAVPVPEPSTLLGHSTLAALGLTRRRRAC